MSDHLTLEMYSVISVLDTEPMEEIVGSAWLLSCLFRCHLLCFWCTEILTMVGVCPVGKLRICFLNNLSRDKYLKIWSHIISIVGILSLLISVAFMNNRTVPQQMSKWWKFKNLWFFCHYMLQTCLFGWLPPCKSNCVCAVQIYIIRLAKVVCKRNSQILAK